MIFIHCGNQGNDNEEFLYCMHQLREKNMTDGCNCFLICVDFIASGKKVVKGSKKSIVQARNEHVAISSGDGN